MRKTCSFGIIAISLLFLAFTAGCATRTVPGGGAVPEEFKKVDLAKSEFIIGVGDTVEIEVYKQDDLKRSVKIDSSGMIMLPLVGDVQASGRSIFKLRDDLRERFSTFLVNPQVTVTVTSIQSKKILVLGEVKNPGVFSLEVEFNLTEVIAKAGGLTNDASQGNILLIRRGKEKPQIMSFNFKDIWKNGDLANDVPVRSGDIVYASTKPIANVSRFMQYIGSILNPIVMLEGGIVMWPQVLDVLQGKSTDQTIVIPTQ